MGQLTNVTRIMPQKHLLNSSETLKLQFRNRLVRPDMHRRVQYRGIAVEFTRVTSAAEYDFSWLGRHHYLALHDLLMDRGEMEVEGLQTIVECDIRDKMTYIPAGLPVKGWSRLTGRQNSFMVLHFDPALLSEETGRVFGGGETVPLIYFEEPHLLSTMRKLESAVAENFEHPAVYVETLALLAVLELGRLQSRGPVVADRTGRLSAAQERLLRDYIEDNVASDVSLDELSRLVQLSRFHLSRRFKSTFGMAPHRYVVERRLDTAKRLLKESDLSVADVATATGFSSAGLFIRTFRTATGVTPLAYRRM